jgi:hypothetical protein
MLKTNPMGEKMEFSDEKISQYRSMIIRCPRLGGEVPFSFCEKEAGDLPCRLVVSCWANYFPIEEYLEKTLTPEALEILYSQRPRDRIATILDIAAAVRKRQSD